MEMTRTTGTGFETGVIRCIVGDAFFVKWQRKYWDLEKKGGKRGSLNKKNMRNRNVLNLHFAEGGKKNIQINILEPTCVCDRHDITGCKIKGTPIKHLCANIIKRSLKISHQPKPWSALCPAAELLVLIPLW